MQELQDELEQAQADQAALQTKVLQSNAAVTSSSLPTVHCRPPRICLLVLLFSGLLALHSCRPCIPTAPKEGTSNIIGLLHLHTYLTLPQIDQERQEHRESRNCEEQTAALAHVTRLQQEVARLKQKLADAEAANGVLQQRATPANSSQASVDSGGTPRCGPVSLCEHSAVADCTVPSDLPAPNPMQQCHRCVCLQTAAVCGAPFQRCNGRAGEMVSYIIITHQCLYMRYLDFEWPQRAKTELLTRACSYLAGKQRGTWRGQCFRTSSAAAGGAGGPAAGPAARHSGAGAQPSAVC